MLDLGPGQGITYPENVDYAIETLRWLTDQDKTFKAVIAVVPGGQISSYFNDLIYLHQLFYIIQTGTLISIVHSDIGKDPLWEL